ncbi:MAG: hypothetical protein J6113_03845 [Lachnospiraceae bacterium]|nr:hypothetical protein [Lachnospiraceae bacterium]
MRQALRDKYVAIAVMVVLILLGLVLGTRVGITREKNKILEKYNVDGLQNDDVVNDTVKLAERFMKAVKEIEMNSSADVFESDIYKDSFKAVQNSIDELEKAKAVEKRYRAAKDVRAAANSLTNTIRDEVSESAQKSIDSTNGALAEKVRSLTDNVDKYNTAAKKLNEKINKFPCSLLKRITFVKDAEIL